MRMVFSDLTKIVSIRMMLFWYMLVLSARCSGSDEIPLDRAEQSSTFNYRKAAYAIDNKDTFTKTHDGRFLLLK